jgi:DNA invertase Pin-like site-specific DNA recombinase
MRIGYARVSSEDQILSSQLDELRGVRCDQIFWDDAVSGSIMKRRGLDDALNVVSTGDEFIVWSFSRLGRSMWEMLSIVVDFERRGIKFRSLCEPYLDSSTPVGRGIIALLGSFAEQQRIDLIKNTRAGMASAKARGVHIGRPRKLNAIDVREAQREIEAGQELAALARAYNVSPLTLARALKRQDGPPAPQNPGPKA